MDKIMKKSDRSLFLRRDFLPLFWTQFAGAFNDNLFRSSLVIFITYELRADNILITVAAGVFILPFLLFSGFAGYLSDNNDKATMIGRVKLLEIVIMFLGSLGFVLANIYILFFSLFCMGAQSAFFGPLKYSILPSHLAKEEYVAGNAYIGAGTFFAILLGTISGIYLPDIFPATFIFVPFVFIAFAGWSGSLFIPPAPPEQRDRRKILTFSVSSWFREIGATLRQPSLRDGIFSISWFWFLGASLLSQLSAFSLHHLRGGEDVYLLMLLSFVIGIGFGSVWCRFLLRKIITLKYSLLCLLGMTLFLADIYLTSKGMLADPDTPLLTAGTFLKEFSAKRLLIAFMGVAFFGGWFVSPLYAVLQRDASVSHRGKVISINNVFNAGFMVLSAVVIGILHFARFSFPEIFLSLSALNVVFAIGRILFLTR